MLLIDKPLFVEEIFIPFTSECTDSTYILMFAKQQRECLESILGNCLYNELKQQFEYNTEATDDDPMWVKWKLVEGVDKKWKWLVYGHTYEASERVNTQIPQWYGKHWHCDCGCKGECDKYHWRGLISLYSTQITSTSAVLEASSLIAYYAYYNFSLQTNTITTTTGEKVADNHNLTSVSNITKRVKSYNKFVSMVQSCEAGGRVGLYKFLSDFSDLFPEWEGKCLRYKSLL